jgi:hypothetical protein
MFADMDTNFSLVIFTFLSALKLQYHRAFLLEGELMMVLLEDCKVEEVVSEGIEYLDLTKFRVQELSQEK